MMIGKQLEQVRVQLVVLHRELCNLAALTTLSPEPDTGPHDDYVRKLDSLSMQLRILQQTYGEMISKRPGKSSGVQGTEIDLLVAQCCERLAHILAPDKRSFARGAGEVAQQLHELLKGYQDKQAYKSVLGNGPSSLPPVGVNADVGVPGFVTLGLLFLAVAKKRWGRG